MNLADNSPKTFARLVALDHLTGMAGAMRSRLMAERLATKTVDGTLGKQTETPQDKALEDMNISVGDTIVLPNQLPDTATQPTPGNRGQSNTLLRNSIPLLMALLGGGLGAAGGYIATRGGDTDVPAAVVDTDTTYEMRPMKLSSGPLE